MQIIINIPDPIYNALKKMDDNVEHSVIKAVELYTARKQQVLNDPLHTWLQNPVKDKDGRSDVSEHHDRYIYGFDK